MKALLYQDSEKGDSFAKIVLSYIGEDINPEIILTRKSDSFSLTPAGWLPDRHILESVPSYIFENRLEIFLDPEITSHINPYEEYVINLSDAYTIPLEWDADFKKLWIKKWLQKETNIIPAAQTPLINSSSIQREETMWGDAARGDNNSGVSAIPNVPMDTPRRRIGCWIFLLIFMIFWGIGTWYLWHLSINKTSETKNPEERTSFFEIIPGSDERTSVDDDMEERKNVKD